MRVQIFSDLHVDVSAPKSIKIADGVDAVICAGDVCEGIDKAFRVLRGFVPEGTPILFVMGNHEFYRRCVPEEIALARALASDFNVRLLEATAAIELCGVRFAGCSLWTDYRYFGAGNAAAAMVHAARGMNDHRLISWSKKPWRRFRPEEALSLHVASKQFLETTLSSRFLGSTVVISHHGLAGSVHPRYQSDLLTAAFVSDLSEMINLYQPDLWVHGHVHNSSDYHVGKTQIICNPHGYRDENPAFNPSLVVEVGS